MAGQKGSSRGAIRWRPTAEQLMILEELFKGGVKSPTSQQVQKITTKLKEHGKVESKNVFYWFQNHKAREKQKLKRNQQQQQQHLDMDFACYNVHPQPQFACGFWPLFPPQAIKRQWISSPAEITNLSNIQTLVTRKGVEETQAKESSWEITWLPTDDSDSNHHRNRSLETLQLFPTTAEATTTAATSSTISAMSASSNNVGTLISL